MENLRLTAVRTGPQLGAALRRRRKLMGLSQAQVADQMGVRQATVSLLESAEADSKVSTLLDLLAALNLDLVVRPREDDERPSIEDIF